MRSELRNELLEDLAVRSFVSSARPVKLKREWSIDFTTSKWQCPDRSSLRTAHRDRFANNENSGLPQITSSSVPLRARVSRAPVEEGYSCNLSSTHHAKAGVVATLRCAIRSFARKRRVNELSGRTACRRDATVPLSVSSGGTRGIPG